MHNISWKVEMREKRAFKNHFYTLSVILLKVIGVLMYGIRPRPLTDKKLRIFKPPPTTNTTTGRFSPERDTWAGRWPCSRPLPWGCIPFSP